MPARAPWGGGRARTSSPARWPTSPRTRRASSPGRSSSWMVAGPRSTGGTSRRPERRLRGPAAASSALGGDDDVPGADAVVRRGLLTRVGVTGDDVPDGVLVGDV